MKVKITIHHAPRRKTGQHLLPGHLGGPQVDAHPRDSGVPLEPQTAENKREGEREHRYHS